MPCSYRDGERERVRKRERGSGVWSVPSDISIIIANNLDVSHDKSRKLATGYVHEHEGENGVRSDRERERKMKNVTQIVLTAVIISLLILQCYYAFLKKYV